MRTIYEAFDGKQFDDEADCENYEWEQEHKDQLSKILFFDENGHVMFDKMSEKTYSTVMQIVVHNKEELCALHDLADYTGFCAYENIEEPGTWFWDDTINDFVKR